MTTRGSKQLLPPPYSLDLNKLRQDIATAQEILAKRLPGAGPRQAEQLKATQGRFGQWSLDIDSICAGAQPGDEPCGTTMVIS